MGSFGSPPQVLLWAISSILYDSTIETLTFLFTDIEQSTALLRRLGDTLYAQVLAEHHEIIRASIGAHDGQEEGTQGDAFFAVFTSPSACLASSLDIQRALQAHLWPDGEQLRVRMGVHTGEVSENATGLVGYEIHRAARIAAVGYGGQILLSSAVAGLVEDMLPGGVALRNLGAHRLKDLGRPEVIFQVRAEGLNADFPPLRSLDSPELPNNLPASLSPFVGRTEELAEVNSLVVRSRLVTLTGAGGSGKTRLALQAAVEFLDGSGEGVWFIELARLSDPEQVAKAVADTLQIREAHDASPTQALVSALHDQDILLILDNCEHVIDVVAELVEQIGRNCPKCSIVTTSREPLGVDGEQVYRVRSLSLPSENSEVLDDIENSDAVALFLAQARLRDSTFELKDANVVHLVSICRRLDGIPLAIELAASRLSSMSLADLNERMDQRFKLLTGGRRNALPRQQTLGAMVSWSYDLLNDQERDVLRRLSVFVNGFNLDAAEYVCGHGNVGPYDVADILGSLMNKNLVTAEPTSDSLRYRLLETIRQYAQEHLVEDDGESEVMLVRKLHAEFFLRLCERAEPILEGSADQIAWMRRLESEWDNLQAALAYFSAESGSETEILRLIVAGSIFFATRLHFEPVAYLRGALASASELPPHLKAKSIYTLAWLMMRIPTNEQSGNAHLEVIDDLYREALELAKSSGDRTRECEILIDLSFNYQDQGDRERAQATGREALELARTTGSFRLINRATLNLGGIREEFDELRKRLLWDAAKGFREANDSVGLAIALLLASVRPSTTDEEIAEDMALNLEATKVAEEVEATFALNLLWGNLSEYCFHFGDVAQAETLNRRTLVFKRRTGWPHFWLAENFNMASRCAASRGEFVRAAQLEAVGVDLDSKSPDYYRKNRKIESETEGELQHKISESIRQALGDEVFQRATEVGRRLTFEQACNLALGRVEFPL